LKIGNLVVYGIIYLIRNKTNNKIYIGQTIQSGGFDARYKHNLENETHNEHLKRSIHKYGIENFEINKEFDIAYSQEELNKLEDMYIKIYNTTDKRYGYNKMFGGSVGKHTEATKIKISNANKGKIIPKETRIKMSENHWSKHGHEAWFKGKHHTEETKQILREFRLGKHWSEESKQKLSNSIRGENHPWYGRHHSNDSKDKMRQSHIGGKSAQAIKIICITTKRIFLASTDAGRFYKCDSSGIIKCCKGKRKICGTLYDGRKLEWKYIGDLTKEEYIKYGIENKLKELHNQELVQAV